MKIPYLCPKDKTKIMIIFKKAIIFGGILCATFAAAPAAPAQQRAAAKKTRQTREEYIERYKHIAIDQMERYGIPASITMAQGILESDCGNSTLSVSSNNHFGIKCKRDWTGGKVYHDDDEKGECFRAYPTVEASYADHAEFLDRQPRYEALFSYRSDDYRSWAHGLKQAGYATAPDYAQRLIRIIEESQLYLLDRPDGGKLYANRNGGSNTATGDEWFADQGSVAPAAAGTIDPDNYRVALTSHNGYNVYATNGVRYVLAGKGDSFDKIGRAFRLSARALRRFNDIDDAKAEPMTGEVIYIERKKNRWEGSEYCHICREGETAYAVAQTYGLRMKAVVKMNRLKQRTTLAAGEQLRIR